MNLDKIHSIYFIGIGGIGMSALAKYFAVNGKKVSGYDKTKTPITQELENSSISIHYKEDVDWVKENFKNVKDALVVYTPAIQKSHKELHYFTNNNFTVLKRAEVLGLITKNTFCFAVAGTHGKTSTSSILGHIMSNYNATSFLGGIAENYHSNLILGGKEISVVEADEFDRSFLQLAPNIACITSMDADHLDIYKNPKDLQDSFKEFANLVSDNVVVANGLPINGNTYGIEDDSNFTALNIRINDGVYVFDIKTPEESLNNVQFSLPGRHNILNALAASTMAYLYGVSLKEIKESLATFKGIERRFSYKIKTDDLVLIDDYAHHPTEINAVSNAIKEMYPNKKSLAIFQPHLYSRTKDFATDFGNALSQFDEVILLDIYPARETPIEGVTSKWLLEKISNPNKKLLEKHQILESIKTSNAKIITMLGAGDIGLLVEDIASELSKTKTHEV